MNEGTPRTYWLCLFTRTSWQEFMAAGATVSAFRLARSRTVHQMRPGDYLLCYLTGVSRFVGALEVTGEPYDDATPILEDDAFPCRVPVRVVSHADSGNGDPCEGTARPTEHVPGHEGPERLDGTIPPLTNQVAASRRSSRCGGDPPRRDQPRSTVSRSPMRRARGGNGGHPGRPGDRAHRGPGAVAPPREGARATNERTGGQVRSPSDHDPQPLGYPRLVTCADQRIHRRTLRRQARHDGSTSSTGRTKRECPHASGD